MCGRFYLETDFDELVKKYGDFQALEREINTGEIFPTNEVGILLMQQKMAYVPLKWGFTPSYAKRPLINARCESLLEKKTFRASVLNRRCIVPANFYYEWKGEKGQKEKYEISSNEEEIMSMAAIYNEEIQAFTIITRDAVPGIEVIHHRMPLILEGNLVSMWLNPNTKENVIREIVKYAYDKLSFKVVI